jgi:hypothetical protein
VAWLVAISGIWTAVGLCSQFIAAAVYPVALKCQDPFDNDDLCTDAIAAEDGIVLAHL